MRYVLLTWNPGPSNEDQYTPEKWLEEMVVPLQAGEPPEGNRWSIGTNWRAIVVGDLACMLRQGAHGRGIVATGVVTSDPYTAPHWNDAKSGDAHYVNVSWVRAMDLNQMITLDELEREVPSFPWRQVYNSGRIIEGDSGSDLAVLLGQGMPTGNGKAKGQQYGNAEHNRLVELEAMAIVRDFYKEEGWTVIDVSKRNLGWDQEARRGKLVKYIEVKGVTGSRPEFFLTPNEYRAAAQQSNWIAVVLTDIFGSEPRWVECEGAEVLATAFPTQYRVTC